MSTEPKVTGADGGSDPAVAAPPETGAESKASEVEPHIPSSSSPSRRGSGSLLAAFVFGYFFCIALVAYGIYRGGIWIILANTRVLDVLIDSGLVAYTDMQMGIVEGLPDLKLYLMSQEPIHWEVLGFVALLYLVFYTLRIVQFHLVARGCGVPGTFGQHTRAFCYSLGWQRLLPFSAGEWAAVAALEGQGASPKKAQHALYVLDLFVWFEILFFLAAGLIFAGWVNMFVEMLPATILLSIIYYMTRKQRVTGREPSSEGLKGATLTALRSFASLTKDPIFVGQLCLLSIVAFALDEAAPYFVSQALSYQEIILHVPFLHIHGAMVAGYLASRIQVTPSGIGQFEMGFGAALMMAGTGLGTSMSILIVLGVLRHGMAMLFFLATQLFYQVDTNITRVLESFKGAQPAGAAAQE